MSKPAAAAIVRLPGQPQGSETTPRLTPRFSQHEAVKGLIDYKRCKKGERRHILAHDGLYQV